MKESFYRARFLEIARKQSAILFNPNSEIEATDFTEAKPADISCNSACICVDLCVMRTASVYEVQHNFSKVLSWVSAGETVIVQRRNVPVAKLIPAEEKRPPLPDFLRRLKETYKDRVLPDSTPILDELRSDRF